MRKSKEITLSKYGSVIQAVDEAPEELSYIDIPLDITTDETAKFDLKVARRVARLAREELLGMKVTAILAPGKDSEHAGTRIIVRRGALAQVGHNHLPTDFPSLSGHN